MDWSITEFLVNLEIIPCELLEDYCPFSFSQMYGLIAVHKKGSWDEQVLRFYCEYPHKLT